MDPVTIGGIIAGAGSLLGSGISAATGGNMNRKNRKWQEKMYKWQLQDQRDNARLQWQENRDYAKWSYDNFESPVAQRAGYKAAGINPFVEGSVLQPMGATQGNASAPDSGSVPSGGPYQFNPGSVIQGGFQGLQGSALQIVQAQNIQAQTELTNATRLKTLAETKSIENANSLFDFVRSAAESDALSKRFKAKIDQVNAEFAEIEAIQDSAERDARIAELWSREKNNLAQAAKTDADRLTVETLRDGMKRLQDAQIDNTEAQTETEGAKQDNLRSGAGLNRAQISRIEELTPAEKKEIRNRAAELANRMQNLSHEQKRRDLDLLLESAGLKNQNEPLLLTASLIKQVRTTIRTLELGDAIEKLFEEVYHVKL